MDQVRSLIPKDALGVGIGMPELYYQLGWDPQVYLMDFADAVSSAEVFGMQAHEIDVALKTRDFYIAMEGTEYNNPEFEAKGTIPTQDFTLIYYERIHGE